MNARPWLCAPKRDDAPDLGQGQSEASGLRYEVEHADDIRGIRAVAGRRASRWREDASRLVQPQSLAAQAAARRHLSDEQSVSRHESRIRLAP